MAILSETNNDEDHADNGCEGITIDHLRSHLQEDEEDDDGKESQLRRKRKKEEL
ncbi:hypothetical protein HHK36_025479 [Tetracentron sinense]|uniref:Uncharacterized protein n=1 Tax=Tetracentron sinense TaxID=13715 RepID=A0A834YGW9_TETSI|nr:hypothetical protein HHK36_025479 [Tetracentron sinense]